MFKPPFKVEDRFKLTELKLICLDIFRLVNVVRQFLHSGTYGLFHLTARPSGSYLQHFGTLLSRYPPIHKAGSLRVPCLKLSSQFPVS